MDDRFLFLIKYLILAAVLYFSPKAETQNFASLHAEQKEKPVRNCTSLWIVGGAIILLIGIGWKIVKTIQKSTII